MDGFERRKVLKKKNIIQAALSLFMKYGIQKVSVAEIAKEATVSQVTIYNYFGDKDSLIREVIYFYVEDVWKEYEQLLTSDLSFPKKIKGMIFEKKLTADTIHEDFYTYFMDEYRKKDSHIQHLYTEKVIPFFMNLLNEGKTKGYIDPSITNEAILIYIQIFINYFQQNEVSKEVIPHSEELTKLFFYGLVGNNKE